MTSDKIQPQKPVLILLYGLPGAGKTHFARGLSEDMQLSNIYADKIRHELFEQPQHDKQENSIITHLMQYMTGEFLSGGASVIYDMNAMRKAQRMELRELARKRHAKTLLVWFQLDAETAYGRLKKRDRRTMDDKYAADYTQDEFKRYASKMQNPEPTEDYVVVSGKHNFKAQKASVVRKLMDMGIVSGESGQSSLPKPGLVNLVPKRVTGRVDMNRRRNINIGG